VSSRYIAKRATTGATIDSDVRVTPGNDQKVALSAAGTGTFTLAPAIAQGVAIDGKPLFQKWGTLLFEEIDGQIRWGGIVTDMSWSGETWSITVDTFATYPHGIPYQGNYVGTQVDPADVLRMLWSHVQGYPDGDLGVVVVGSTNLKIGSTSTQKRIDAQTAYDAAAATAKTELAAYNALRATETKTRAANTTLIAARTLASKARTTSSAALTAAKKTKNAAQIAAAKNDLAAKDAAYVQAKAAVVNKEIVVDQDHARSVAQYAVYQAANKVKSTRSDALSAAKDAESADGGAYILDWWDAPDVGDTIDSLMSDHGIDWTEKLMWVPEDARVYRPTTDNDLEAWLLVNGWTADPTDSDFLLRPASAVTETIAIMIVVAYPRIGRKRTDLMFIGGVNVMNIVEPTDSGDDYANEVVGIGSGEGAASIRRTTALADGNLRRPFVLTAKDLKTKTDLDRRIAAALPTKMNTLTIPSIDVVDHPNAKIGSWQVGDDIAVDVVIPWLGRQRIWHRITDWTRTADYKATLSLKRSDSFTYGG
jgi:hypothetical protein